ncbi:MAG: cation-translocating P-type ATPase, partial [Rhodothermaceae bacterium]|nr:cation-translocating P-type ATPase [Rhodothermaceae bacterium]
VEAGQRTEAERRLLIRLGVAWALAGNVMLVAFALYSGLDAVGGALETAARWASLVLAAPAVAYGGAPFFQRAWASIRTAVAAHDPRRLHMDTPIALGIAVGFGHSAWATVVGRGEVWFDSITVLIAALLTARYLQLRSRRLAGEAADRLLTLVPTTARRIGEGGSVEIVRQDELRRDDVVEVPAGEVLPVDGLVVHGASRLDNAVLTGEARPVTVVEGGRVSAGATNLSAPLRVRTEAAGEATRVGRLLAWVRETDGQRAPVVLLADRIGGAFLLSVFALAMFTAVLWAILDPSQAAQHTAALLVITCPCALGMATPLALAIAAGRAARSGLFIKSDGATQRLTDVDTVVLDKTGTLTEGRMALVEWVGDDTALDLATALEAQSNHPIAAALVRARGDEQQPEVYGFEAVAGQGVHGLVGHHHVVVGRPAWCGAKTSQPLPTDFQTALDRFAQEGSTPVGVLVDGAWKAMAAFGDRLRDEAGPLVHALEREGKTVHLLSGDHPAAVAAVASHLGLAPDRAHGGVSPEAKRAAVGQLQAEGHVVLMVGDGVNDAAALRAADVGVAVGGGTTVSLVAADVFLTRPGLTPLADLFQGARSVMRTIRRLLGLSLAYNLIGAGAAVAGLVTPLVAAVAMPASSLLVVGLAILQPSFRRARGATP